MKNEFYLMNIPLTWRMSFTLWISLLLAKNWDVAWCKVFFSVYFVFQAWYICICYTWDIILLSTNSLLLSDKSVLLKLENSWPFVLDVTGEISFGFWRCLPHVHLPSWRAIGLFLSLASAWQGCPFQDHKLSTV